MPLNQACTISACCISCHTFCWCCSASSCSSFSCFFHFHLPLHIFFRFSSLSLSCFREWNFKCLAADVFFIYSKIGFYLSFGALKKAGADAISCGLPLSLFLLLQLLLFVIFPRSSTNYDNDNTHCAPALCLCIAKTVRRILLLPGSFSHQFGKLPSSRANEPADAKTEIEPPAED